MQPVSIFVIDDSDHRRMYEKWETDENEQDDGTFDEG